jgi:hypothetical protein
MFIFLKFSKFLMAILKKMKINKKEMRSDKNIIIIFSIKISQQLVSCRDRLNVGHLYIYMLCSRASTQQLYIIVAYINRTSSKLNPLSKKKKKKSSPVESCADEIPGVA